MIKKSEKIKKIFSKNLINYQKDVEIIDAKDDESSISTQPKGIGYLTPANMNDPSQSLAEMFGEQSHTQLPVFTTRGFGADSLLKRRRKAHGSLTMANSKLPDISVQNIKKLMI